MKRTFFCLTILIFAAASFSYTARACHFIKENKQQPFFLYLLHSARTYKLNLPGYDGFPGAQPEVNVPLGPYDMRRDPGETLDVQRQFPEVGKTWLLIAEKPQNELGDDLTDSKGKERRVPENVQI